MWVPFFKKFVICQISNVLFGGSLGVLLRPEGSGRVRGGVGRSHGGAGGGPEGALGNLYFPCFGNEFVDGLMTY